MATSVAATGSLKASPPSHGTLKASAPSVRHFDSSVGPSSVSLFRRGAGSMSVAMGKLLSRSQSKSQGTTGPEPQGLLCLHGWRSNNAVSRTQATNLRLSSYFSRVDFLHGPVKADGPADSLIGDFFEGPYFSWVEKDIEESVQIDQLRSALEAVVEHVRSVGPYQCVYGFSNGGAIAAMLSIPAVLKQLGVTTPLWSSAVITCGSIERLTPLLVKAFGLHLSEGIITLPSLHVIGTDDPHKSSSEDLAQLFAPADFRRHVVYFPGGHGVPAMLQKSKYFKREVGLWMRRTRHPMAMPVSPSAAMQDGGLSESRIAMKFAPSDATTASSSPQPSLLPALQDLSVAPKQIDGPGKCKLTFDNEGLSIVLCKPTRGGDEHVSIGQFLARNDPESDFIRGRDQKPLTYGALLAFIRGAGDLRHCGVQSASDLVAYPAPPGPVGAVAMLTIGAQCAAVPVSPDADEVEASDILDQFKPSKLLAFRGSSSPGFEAAADAAGMTLHWQVIDAAVAGLYAPESPSVVELPLGGNITNSAAGTALFLRTSGTTSKPKVVPLQAGALCANGVALAASLGLRKDDVCINVMPLFHIGGLSCSILATIAGGGSVLCAPKFEASTFLEHLTTVQPLATWYSSVPTIHMAVLNYAKSQLGQEAPKHALRFIRSGAAALSHSDAVKLRDFWGVPVIPTYSMSEQMPISGKPVSLPMEVCPDTVGQPVCSSVALVDAEWLCPVPFGNTGEICISGPNVMTAYLNNPTANAKSFFYIGEQRYFRTGDIGKFDSDAHLYLVGRSKELIKRGGEQVSPPEVEAVIGKHPNVKVVVVFSVESEAWGEEVGAAIILRGEKPKPEVEQSVINEIRRFAAERMGAMKVPSVWRIVQDGDLPMTGSNKYIRIGLAEFLGIGPVMAPTPEVKAPSISSSLSGLRYILGVGVMFNHIGAVWTGEDGRNPLTFGPGFSNPKSSTFYFPATVFFVMGGFTLSSALSAKAVKTGKWFQFYNARIQTLMPLYLLSLFFGFVNLLITCRPDTYSDTFSWQPHPSSMLTSSGDMAACHSGPVEMPYFAWLFLTIVMFVLGLQTWFPVWLVGGWMMFYTWFNGVYYFVILVFPWMHNALVRVRGNVKALNRYYALYSAGIYFTAALLALYYLLPEWEEATTLEEAQSWEGNMQNIYALATMLFPPCWIPCVGSGMVAYFWFDAKRPHQNHNCWKYSVLCDALTAFFVVFHVLMFIEPLDWPYPAFLDNGLKRYVWSVLITRLYSPVMGLWLALLSMPGKSYTARLLEWEPLSGFLGSTSYGCFLFHQIVAQWYWWATRAGATSVVAATSATSMSDELKTHWSWWEYKKEYYWFSPKPVPVAWYEFFFVVMLTTLFSALCNATLLAPLTTLWIRFVRLCTRRGGAGGVSAHEIMAEAVMELTGEDQFALEATLGEVGLGSVGLPMLVGLLNSKEDALSLQVSDIASLANLGEVVELIDAKLKHSQQESGVGQKAL